MSSTKHQVVFIGGGTGTMMTSAQLLRYGGKNIDVAIIEPNDLLTLNHLALLFLRFYIFQT
jgi:NADH dehydrogenase FAD-containing subunit